MNVRRLARPAAVLALAASCAGPAVAQQTADLVLRGGRVVTMEESRPEAQAVAVVGDRIAAVGSDAEMAAWVGPGTRIVELDGRLLVPGFIEGHGHFMGLGRAQQILDLTVAVTWDDIVAMVARAAEEAGPGEWIYGRGWHQEKWSATPEPSVDGVPLHHALSRVSPDNPVVLTHASGHAAFVNAAAMAAAGITRYTPDPDGGTIVRDADGEPTGLLRETAEDLVGEAAAAAEAGRSAADIEAQRREQARLAAEVALANGVTTFHDAGSSFRTIDFFRRLADEGALPLRLYVMIRDDPAEYDEKLDGYRTVGYGDGFLTVRAIKHSIDGALGSHGAWLLRPYADLPTTGHNTTDPDVIRRTAELAVQHGYQLNTHAIGDRANRVTLDIYEEAFRSAPAEDRRWRIEHAQHVHPDDVPRFAELGVIASMQGIHATSDGPWVLARLGEERARTESYLWRDFLDHGVVVTNGTDVPVEDISPIQSFHASVTRRMSNGETFYPEQRMTRAEALRSYTLANAFAAFEEDTKGSITPGKLADLVVLDRDILQVPEAEILDARADVTIVGGEVKYERAR